MPRRGPLTLALALASCAAPEPLFDVEAGEEAFWASCTAEGGASIDGPIEIASASDLEALAGVAVVGGDLSIAGTPGSLAPLADLRCVRGALSIHDTTALETLEGLEGLVAIEGDLELHRNLRLASLEGLSSLRFVDPFRASPGADLSIVGNDALADLRGLGGLTELRGDLVLRSNASLVTLAGLEGLRTVWGDLVVFGHEALETTEGLDGLESVEGRVEIRENPALTGVGFRRLAIVDEHDERPTFRVRRGIHIERNAVLFNVGFPALVRAVNVQIRDNPELRGVDLGALRELRARMTTEGDLLVSGPRLSAIDLASLERVDDELFVWGQELDRLEAPRLAEVGGHLRVGSPTVPRLRNASVEILDLRALTSVGGDLVLDLTSLDGVDGLSNLERVGGALEIVNNPALRSLRGLARLSMVVGRLLEVRANAVLPTCEAEALLAQLAAAGYTGHATIGANDDDGVCP